MGTKIQQLIYSMLTESTGSHIADSGGMSGRHWQRNQQYSIEEFIARPQATLELDIGGWVNARAELFHALSALKLDDVCDKYNALNTGDAPWDIGYGEYYGQNSAAGAYLEKTGLVNDKGTTPGNTCDWDSNNLTQDVLYFPLKSADGDNYVLISIHNGCDARGGHTAVKLFKDADDYRELWRVLQPTMYFTVEDVEIDIQGAEVVDVSGYMIETAVLADLATRHTEIIAGRAIYE